MWLNPGASPHTDEQQQTFFFSKSVFVIYDSLTLGGASSSRDHTADINNNNSLAQRSQATSTHLFGISVISTAGNANAPPSHRNRTVCTDPWLSALAHNTATNILLFRLSLCVCVCVCVCVCIHKQHTDGVPKRQLHNPYHCALSVCQRVCVKCDGWQSLRLNQVMAALTAHIIRSTHARIKALILAL